MNIYQYDKELLMQLRIKVYYMMLALLVTLSTVWVLMVDIAEQREPIDMLSIWLTLLVVCGLSYQLRQMSLSIAIHTLFVGLIVSFAYTLRFNPSESFLALIPAIIPIGTLLLGRRSAFVLTLITLLIFVASSSQFIAEVNYPTHLVVILLSFITSTIIIQEFYGLLTTMQDYQMYALEQMRDARQRRSILAKKTEQLARSAEHLSYANQQLRIAKQKIAEAHKLKAQFAANVSHELRTPINLVVGFAETIMRFPHVYGGQTLPTVYVSDIRTIYRNAKHLQNLINDVLDISQIESGHMALVKEALTIDGVVHEAVNMLRDQIYNKELDLHIDISDSLPTMWLDRVRMRQVFINLLANAIRFTDNGHISICAYEKESCLIICFSDTGIGIQSGEEEHIFEEFYQTYNINRRGEGSGLGLTLCRRFIQMHSGEIWAERLDIGSKFWIKLPTETPSPLATTGEMRSFTQEKNTVIILSDDLRILDFFERHFNKQNVIGIQQFDAIEGYLDTNPIAIIINKQDFHKLEDHPLLDTVASSMSIITCPMPSGRRYMQSLGVEDYLIKPVSADMLKLSIEHLPTLPQHILIVDDERELVRLFTHLLKAILPDCHLTMAYSGQEAIALLDSLRPDLILLDIIMPDIDGLTVLEVIKANSEIADIPVIIASAKGASEAISPSTDGELVVHKLNGFQPIELLQCIETMVDHLKPLT